MTPDIKPDYEYDAGETVQWTFEIKDELGGSLLDLSGATVEYYLLQDAGDANADAIADHSGGDIQVDTSALGSGEVQVEVQAAATQGRGGQELWHRLIVEDATGPPSNTQKFSGPFPVNEG